MSPGKKRHRSRAQLVRENLEAILVAIVLALIIRHFSLEAFEIPTGSMAPTLRGVHAWVTCPSCGTRSALSLSTDRETGKLIDRSGPVRLAEAVCEGCGYRNVVILDTRGRSVTHRAVDVPGARGRRVRGVACEVCGRPVRLGPPRTVYGIPFYRAGHGRGGDRRLTCPVCWFRWNGIVRRGNVSGGHKILVNKFYYRFVPPRPWDVIVFRFNRKTNYIKRLVGLPGDRIRIRHGDVYRNGAISRKPVPVQRALWTLLYDSDRPGRFEAHVPGPAWASDGRGEDPAEGPPLWRWIPERRALVLHAEGARARVRSARPCRNFYAYDQLLYDDPRGGRTDVGRTALQDVGDRRIAFTLAWAGGRGGLRIAMEDGPDVLRCWIPCEAASAASPAYLERARGKGEPERALAAGDERAWIPRDRPVRIGFENADDRLRLDVDGREVLRLDFMSGSPAVDRNGLTLEARDLVAELRSIRIYRDVFYTRSRGLGHAEVEDLVLGPDEYFALGDNSPSSSDGRVWGPLPARNLLGKAFAVFWPALPWRWEVKLIR